ncbi:response regulator [Rhizosaccharibacter radicis]|uniref:Response regulator n=1 Tax=Rhizosaccharibacter radicis TaxID=2782605 RepID=A0ABT1W127_9PROT|nr:response regulator [Acetobacteraceae bacterium KSS12]
MHTFGMLRGLVQMRVLLVEDEEPIRSIIAEELREAGYEVVEASDGDEAMALLEPPADAFRMLITDIHMPGREDGIGVATAFRRSHPDQPLIFTTGRPEALDRIGTLGSHEALLLKPYRPRQLIAAMKRLTV